MFQIQAQVDGVKTLQNNSLKISLETQDISLFTPEEIAELFRLNKKTVWVALKEQPVKVEDLDIKPAPKEKGEKTPSQRLRGALYVLWEQSRVQDDFDTFYKKQMEKIIDFVKEKLEG